MTIYDALGAAHQTQVFFHKTAAGVWDWHAMTDGGGLAGGTPGTLTEIAAGDAHLRRRRASSPTSTQNAAIQFNPLGATAPQALAFNFGDPTGTGGTGLGGVTQFASDSASTFIGQDGFGSGQLSSIQIDTQGYVPASSPTARPGSWARWRWRASPRPTGWRASAATCTPRARPPASRWSAPPAPAAAPRSSPARSSSRTSTWPSSSFALIAAQRSFEANSKSITTADQLLSELIAMKR